MSNALRFVLQVSAIFAAMAVSAQAVENRITETGIVQKSGPFSRDISYFQPGGAFDFSRREILEVRQCGSTQYSCDDTAFPDCRWDSSEENWFCAPDDVVHCENQSGWDYWCKTSQYCCTGGCCQ